MPFAKCRNDLVRAVVPFAESRNGLIRALMPFAECRNDLAKSIMPEIEPTCHGKEAKVPFRILNCPCNSQIGFFLLSRNLRKTHFVKTAACHYVQPLRVECSLGNSEPSTGVLAQPKSSNCSLSILFRNKIPSTALDIFV